MDIILQRKKDRKVQIENDLPLLQKLISIVKNNEIEIRELEAKFKINLPDVYLTAHQFIFAF